VGLVIVAAIGIIGVLYGQRVYDSILASQFHPTTEVKRVDNRLNLTSRGTDLLYASQATIEPKDQFNTNCKSSERTAAILGCYYMRKIHLYQVDNADLDGALEVTAAHEMLHAAYERLNFIERMHVDSLIQDEYQTLRKNPTIAEEMAYYQKAEPGAETNELHSIIGTTVKDISPALEKYYAQYFSNRDAVVTMNEQYNAVFERINAEANSLQEQIDTLKPQVQTALASYESDRKRLEQSIIDFNNKAANDGFPSQYSFTAARNSLTAEVAAMNVRMTEVNSLVADYNAKVEQLNKLSVKAREYNQSINGAEASPGVS
jgi:hypothetical protein